MKNYNKTKVDVSTPSEESISKHFKVTEYPSILIYEQGKPDFVIFSEKITS